MHSSLQLTKGPSFTSNSSKSIFWTIFEVFSRPDLLAKVRDVIEISDECDTRRLSETPLLRSIFYEVLRLRAVGLVPRRLTATGHDFHFDGWSVPSNSVLALSSWHGAMNQDIWNQGTSEEPHPIEDFWEERFVIYPGKPDSGPVRKEARSGTFEGYRQTDEKAEKEGVFSTEGLNGAFLPFGGGASKCPGRVFANREAVLTLTQLAARYDIELRTPAGWQPRMLGGFFPLGLLPPKDKIPFRIRLRSC